MEEVSSINIGPLKQNLLNNQALYKANGTNIDKKLGSLDLKV